MLHYIKQYTEDFLVWWDNLRIRSFKIILQPIGLFLVALVIFSEIIFVRE